MDQLHQRCGKEREDFATTELQKGQYSEKCTLLISRPVISMSYPSWEVSDYLTAICLHFKYEGNDTEFGWHNIFLF